jgi:hypothetical protein
VLTKSTEPDLVKLQVLDDDESSKAGFIEGYASVFGNTDLGVEVVQKGAFAKTLKERLKKGSIKLVDSHAVFTGTQAVIGIVEDAKEDDYGLWFRARLSATSRAQDIRQKIKEKILDALSFGYDVMKDALDPKTGVRSLLELKLYEISVVIWGMNPKAVVEAVKSVIPFQDWPIEVDEKVPWSNSSAGKRFRAWVSAADSADWSASDWAKFKRGHLWFDSSAADNLGSYKFQVVDVVDGQPKYIFRAASASLAILRGGRGAGPSADWWDDRDKMEGHVGRIYKKFGKTMPDKGFEDPEAEDALIKVIVEAAEDLEIRNLLIGIESYAQCRASGH